MTSVPASLSVAVAVGSVCAAILVSIGCSSSDSAPDGQGRTSSLAPTQAEAAEQAIRQAADDLIQAINDRDYNWIVSNAYTTNCSRDVTEEQQRLAWEAVGQRLGDGGYSLEIRDFEVKRVDGDQAEVTATVVVHASGSELSFGTSSDPFFDLFVREGNQWKVADPSC